MQRSKTLISQALATLKGNMDRTGDPLGFKGVYWNGWARGLGLPDSGETVLLTARMYQMLPFVAQATEMSAAARPLLPLLAVNAFSKMALMAGDLVGEPLLRLKAKAETEIRSRGNLALQGISCALKVAGCQPAYLYDTEPYSGALLFDLGLDAEIAPHVRLVYRTLKGRGVKTVITVDPHTTYMMREVFPRYISNYDLGVVHYLDLLASSSRPLEATPGNTLPEEFVIHDSCVMTRDLGIVAQTRKVAAGMGFRILEPENAKGNTACCGGPVEYAFGDLSSAISGIRIRELAGVCRDVLVTCPICLINLMKYENDLGIRVWDMGELLLGARAGTCTP